VLIPATPFAPSTSTRLQHGKHFPPSSQRQLGRLPLGVAGITTTIHSDAPPTPPDSCDDSDKSDDTTSTPILTPAEIKIKRKIDGAIAALKGAQKDLERLGKPGTLDRLGYREIEDLSKGMRQREAAQEE
jgi:hypothetical protein